MERRSFLKMSAALGCAATVTGCNSSSKDAEPLPPQPPVDEKIDWSCCTCNCGHNCPLKVVTVDGKITRVETDDVGGDEFGTHQVRACLKGRSSRKKVYSPDRLNGPMKRVGPRGLASSFVECTWEEAFDTIAENLKKVYSEAGPSAVYPHYGTGRLYANYSGGDWRWAGQWGAKLMCEMGGYLNHYGTYSSSQQLAAMTHTYGTNASSTYTEILDSDLVVAFGFNPAETRMSGGGGTYDWSTCTQGKKVIMIDPRYSDSALGKEDKWLAIRPGTDAALCEALAYELISTNRHNKSFLDKYCVGFDSDTLPASAPAGSDYYSHIMGFGEDNTAKTPEWAEKITGIAATDIVELANTLASANAPFICQGLGPQRHAIGEQTVRAIVMLPLLLGKVGVDGTNSGTWPGHGTNSISLSPKGDNPYAGSISFFTWIDAIERGTEFTAESDGLKGVEKLDSNIRFIWNYAGNALINQHSDSFGTHKILAAKEADELFILVHDVFMTPSAKYADILLPDLTDLEQTDVSAFGGTNQETVIPITSSVDCPVDAKDCFEVTLEIAKRLGVEGPVFEGKDYNQWLHELYARDQARANGTLPNYDDLVKGGLHKIKKPEFKNVAFSSFFADPETNKLNTPTGKVEIYSETLADMGNSWELPEGDSIPAIPKYHKTWESYEDTETRDTYPIQLIGHHTKSRTHSSFHNIKWMQEAYEDAVWMNPKDASERGITDGAKVEIHNDRGSVIIAVKVTPLIMPGVASLAQGAWLDSSRLDEKVDMGGNVNSLTKYHPTPIGKCNPQHTNLVQIRLA
ncbi:DMSO/selenate family reductase complex A subunit, partial [Shewanella sp. 10N.286.52.A9]|uniref:DMSO/selenate family reductase complex A subunit n=1 Tax=Shewanella sp. 10N.286.52.A9 TaxID=3229711 RepID=UPI00354D52CF